MWDQTLPLESPQPVLGLQTSADTCCTCWFSAIGVLSSAGEELCWEGQEEGRGHKRKGQGRSGHEKREREGAMRRGVGAHSQPPQEHLLSITSGPRHGDSVTHHWAPPPTVLPSTAAAPVFAPAALIPLQQRDLLQHTSDTPLWASATFLI